MKKIIKYVIALFMTFLSLYLVFIVFKLNVLPLKYMLLFISLVLVFNVIGHITLFMKKGWVKVFTGISYVLLTIISFLGINYGLDTLNFLNKSFNNNDIEITTYNLIVLKNSRYEDFVDLDNEKIGYLDNDDNKDKILANLREKIGFKEVDYTDIYDIYEDFVNKNVEAIFLDNSFIEMLEDEKGSIFDCLTKCSFKDDYRIIYSVDIETKKENRNEDVKLKPMNIYLSGSDSRSKVIQNKSRSDVNMILTINPNTKTILMTSIPRDYYVAVNGKTGLKDKLTHAGIYGIDTSRKTLEDLFNIDILYSIKVSMSSVTEVVDLVGGIDIYSDTEFNSYHYKGWHVKKGMNHMDGEHALAYARERYAYSSGDRHRIKNQQQVLEAVLKKIVQDKTILTKYDKLLDSLSNLYRTDIPSSLITELVKGQIDAMDSWTFMSNSVSGSDASMATYTAPKSKRYVMVPYKNDVDNAKEKIESVLKG